VKAQKQTSQGAVKAVGEGYTGKDGKERVKFVMVGEAFAVDPESGNGAKSLVKLWLLPYPQASPKGGLQSWLHIFPHKEHQKQEEKEKFKLSGIVRSDKLQIGAEFSSPSGRRRLKLEACPIPQMGEDGKTECILKIFDLPKTTEKENKNGTKHNRKDA